jgi:hypothetical protein
MNGVAFFTSPRRVRKAVRTPQDLRYDRLFRLKKYCGLSLRSTEMSGQKALAVFDQARKHDGYGYGILNY